MNDGEIGTTLARRRSRTCRDAGSATVVLVLIFPALLLGAGLLVDGGRALAARQRAADEAEQAARAGADALAPAGYRSGTPDTLDVAAAQAAVTRYLAATGDRGDPIVLAAGVLTVTVHASTQTALLAMIGLSAIHASSTASAQAVRGVISEEP